MCIRDSTPTASAEVVTEFNFNLLGRLKDLKIDIYKAVLNLTENLNQKIQLLKTKLKDPKALLREKSQKLYNIEIIFKKYQHYLDEGYNEELLAQNDIQKGDPFVGVVGLASNTNAVDKLAGPLSPNLEMDPTSRAISSPFHVLGLLITPFENKGTAMHPIEEGMLTAGDGWFAQTIGLAGLLFLVNMVFWLIWVNFLLGITNLIPMIPFDGGHMMRDTLRDLSLIHI